MTVQHADDILDLRADDVGEPRVRVVIVDDDPRDRSALAESMGRHAQLSVAGVAATVHECVEVVERTRPDVVLCSSFLPDGDASELTRRLRPADHPPSIVVVTRLATPSAADACTAAGAHLCLRRDAPPESVAQACVAAARGDQWAGPGTVRSLPQHRLTSLESKVLAEVASGSTNDDIAHRLGYSPNYVKDVLASARGRLGARDRAHAAAMAVALRLVRPGADGRFVPAISPEATPDSSGTATGR